MSLSLDGTKIVSVSDDKTVTHSDYTTSVSFSPNGTRIVSGSTDITGRMWDAVTGDHRQTPKGHSNWITTVVSPPDAQG